MVEELSGKQGYARGLAVDRAAEMVYTQQSEETYGLLVVERGWSAADWSSWVERHVAAELFPGNARDSRQSS